ncbi:MAG: hypothetical protein ACLP66_14845, partial [Polyangia bacterium]
MPGDYSIAALIVRRIQSGSPDRETGILQLAFAVWAAKLDGIVVTVDDVCTVLRTEHVSAST